ncbi:MAG TPA: hypothetical protein VMN78_08375 [Longimicrobiales bacterium]|nr:hypothetical protein [Longimicrobiales bacterium]
MATLTVAVLVGVQPLSGQIGEEISPPAGAVTPRPQEQPPEDEPLGTPVPGIAPAPQQAPRPAVTPMPQEVQRPELTPQPQEAQAARRDGPMGTPLGAPRPEATPRPQEARRPEADGPLGAPLGAPAPGYAPTPQQAQRPDLRPRPQVARRAEVTGQEHTHVVRPADTLWDLAEHYYQNPFFWPTIHDANRQVVEDPHWIYPNEVLVIPGVPTAIAEGPPGAPGVITQVSNEPLVQVAVRPNPTARTRFYRANELGPGVFIDAEVEHAGVQPGEHYASPWLADPSRMPIVGVVHRTVDAPPGDAEQDLLVHRFDDVYVEYRGATRPRPGERLMVVDVLREFDDGADLFVIRPAGVLTVLWIADETMTARLTEHWAPFSRGARVLPLDAFPAILGLAEPVTDGPAGSIVGFMIEQPLYSTTDYGFLDLNESQVRIGDVVLIYRLPRDDGNVLPPEPVAFVKIVRVGPSGSTFRVTKVMQRRLEPGLPALVVSRIP